MDNKILEEAHKACQHNKEFIMRSDKCGCFYCGKIFIPADIKEWVGIKGDEALCCYCGIDTVIGSAHGYELTEDFLNAMYDYWFGNVLPRIK